MCVAPVLPPVGLGSSCVFYSFPFAVCVPPSFLSIAFFFSLLRPFIDPPDFLTPLVFFVPLPSLISFFLLLSSCVFFFFSAGLNSASSILGCAVSIEPRENAATSSHARWNNRQVVVDGFQTPSGHTKWPGVRRPGRQFFRSHPFQVAG